jgi:hypothetical protein
MNEHITIRTHVLRLLGPLVFCALAWPSVASAQSDPTPADLTKASVETLLNVEITSASKHEQSIRDTAAAVFVLTHDVRRHS